VLFTDFVDFTKISENLSPEMLVSELHRHFTAFDDMIARHGLEKIKTIGDAYMAVCGLPVPLPDHAQRAAGAALEIPDFVRAQPKLSREKLFDIRIWLNSGSVVAGIVGGQKFACDIWGDTVNTAARMGSSSGAGKINPGGATHALLQSDFACTYRGKTAAKNKGEIDMCWLEGR
jgi:class 3 adenylate cyclase